MEAKGFLILVFVVAIWGVEYTDCASHHSQAPAPAPGPTVDCSGLILNMAGCLSFVSNGSTDTKPEESCCSGLGTVLKDGPQCLCEAFKSSAQLGIVLNVTKALSLPALCNLPASKATDCGLSVAPVAAPPALSPGSAQTGDSSSGEPPSSPKSSGSTPLLASAGALAIGLAAVSFFSF